MNDTKALSKEDRLKLVCQSYIDNYEAFKAGLREGRSNEKLSSTTLWGFFQVYGLKTFILDNDVNQTKLCFHRVVR